MMKVWLIILVFVAVPAWSGSIIKCRAADGSITFSDSRCPAGQQQVSKKTFQQRRVQKTTTLKNLESASEYPAEEAGGLLSNMVFQSRFAQVLSVSSVLKLSMTEYYIYRGQWPDSLEDLKLDPSSMTSSQITATEISGQGRIRLQLNSEFGENKEVWLYPREVMGGMQIEWACYSNFPAKMLTNAGGFELCQSRYF